MSEVFRPIQDFTDALSEERYVSVSYVKPVLYLFNTTILAEEDNNTELTKDVKRNILAYLNEKSSTDDQLNITSFLDPRYRTTYTKERKSQTRNFQSTRRDQVTKGSTAGPSIRACCSARGKKDKYLVQLFKKAQHQQHGQHR
ncbi:E3 SUMO-protein ligase ZBED1-like [Hyla sarda]|uniref:E3 SUMO-protein ligase ZBED1-like n=1 Tax=Hyla sarda TaxID=327740 RepID=UPI0024C2BFFB|nr:E3 SUMO-protein ligase ZBED1-like [Hyla sarda]